MLTVQKLDGAAPNVEALLNSNAVVGYCTGSYLQNYLVDVLRFKTQNIRNYTTLEAYAQAFKNKEIAAVFLEVPLAKLFLAKYCRRFVLVGPTYKVGGFGFVRYPLLIHFPFIFSCEKTGIEMNICKT
jgi:hypothetical protein